MQPKNDPVIEEIREQRRRISGRCEHDPAKLVAYYMELQKQYADRLFQNPAKTEESDQSAA
jgi:hypothetical protein